MLRSISSSILYYEGVKIIGLLRFTKTPFAFYVGHSYSSHRYSFCGKKPLAIAATNAELPPFKNGEHNFESASTIDLGLTPLMKYYKCKNLKWTPCSFLPDLLVDVSKLYPPDSEPKPVLHMRLEYSPAQRLACTSTAQGNRL